MVGGREREKGRKREEEVEKLGGGSVKENRCNRDNIHDRCNQLGFAGRFLRNPHV